MTAPIRSCPHQISIRCDRVTLVIRNVPEAGVLGLEQRLRGAFSVEAVIYMKSFDRILGCLHVTIPYGEAVRALETLHDSRRIQARQLQAWGREE